METSSPNFEWQQMEYKEQYPFNNNQQTKPSMRSSVKSKSKSKPKPNNNKNKPNQTQIISSLKSKSKSKSKPNNNKQCQFNHNNQIKRIPLPIIISEIPNNCEHKLGFGCCDDCKRDCVSFFRCQLCHKDLKSVMLMQDHIYTHPLHINNKIKYRCSICNEQFDVESKLSSHKEKHLKITPMVYTNGLGLMLFNRALEAEEIVKFVKFTTNSKDDTLIKRITTYFSVHNGPHDKILLNLFNRRGYVNKTPLFRCCICYRGFDNQLTLDNHKKVHNLTDERKLYLQSLHLKNGLFVSMKINNKKNKKYNNKTQVVLGDKDRGFSQSQINKLNADNKIKHKGKNWKEFIKNEWNTSDKFAQCVIHSGFDKQKIKNKSSSILIPDYRGLEYFNETKDEIHATIRHHHSNYLNKIGYYNTILFVLDNKFIKYYFSFNNRISFAHPIIKLETLFSFLLSFISNHNNCQWNVFKVYSRKLFGLICDWILICTNCGIGMIKQKYKGSERDECLEYLNQFINDRDITNDKFDYKITTYYCRCIQKKRKRKVRFCSMHCAKMYWNTTNVKKRNNAYCHSCYNKK